jgi:hypothetical protein
LNIALNSNCLLLSISSLSELASHHPSAVIFKIFCAKKSLTSFAYSIKIPPLFQKQRTCSSSSSKEPFIFTKEAVLVCHIDQTWVSIMV